MEDFNNLNGRRDMSKKFELCELGANNFSNCYLGKYVVFNKKLHII